MAEMTEGYYDRLITAAMRRALDDLPVHLKAITRSLEPSEAVEYFAREVFERARSHLSEIASEQAPVARANELLESIDGFDPVFAKVLAGILPKAQEYVPNLLVPLTQSALITNSQGVNYFQLLRSELETADKVDLICPFIGSQGLNLIWKQLAPFGPRLRVITTTYLGGSHANAIERLAAAGAQVKVVYERADQKTALHAKAWIFHRLTGFTTATIGSSNLSPRALVDGLEWNLRLGARDSPALIEELRVTFDRLWELQQFEPYQSGRDRQRLVTELRANRSERTEESGFFADLVARPHQGEALDALKYARLEGRHRNLIVAATGTGKTLIAAFDYARIARETGGRPRLLFVAHREDILRQSRSAFRAVLRDETFGEASVGDQRATEWNHVFASVQSLANRDLEEFHPEHFELIVIDEFHHAEAPTYSRILKHFQPKEMLGLTATPERADGCDQVIGALWPPTFELRLWHALERQLLCPFHYYGIDDTTDISRVEWRSGRYDLSGLESVYLERGRARDDVVLRELADKAPQDNLRAVAFCASVRHADHMASVFEHAGYKASSLHSRMDDIHRRSLVRAFRDGDLQIICTVDLFNEGIDVPEINTVLFLRPTESATVFIQQLGRGLRNHETKGVLTVLDFVGNQNQKFRFDLRYRAMTGLSRRELDASFRTGFAKLPPGCDIWLDQLSRDRVLASLRTAIPSTFSAFVDEARRLAATADGPIALRRFLEETGVELEDLYRNSHSFAEVCYKAGLMNEEPSLTHGRIGRLLHVNDHVRVEQYRSAIQEGRKDSDYGKMLFAQIGGDPEIMAVPELLEVFEELRRRAQPLPSVADDLPFRLHALYTRDEIASPYRANVRSMRQGVFYAEDRNLDVHLVTLRKSERHFSPTTRYQDFFLSPTHLHWESQSTTSQASPTGQRLVQRGSRVLFFVRETREEPFLCVGLGELISWRGDRPIQMEWRLSAPIPDHIYVRFQSAAG